MNQIDQDNHELACALDELLKQLHEDLERNTPVSHEGRKFFGGKPFDCPFAEYLGDGQFLVECKEGESYFVNATAVESYLAFLDDTPLIGGPLSFGVFLSKQRRLRGRSWGE